MSNYGGFRNASKAMGSIFTRGAFNDGYGEEEKRLAGIDRQEASAEQSRASAYKLGEEAKLAEAKSKELQTSQDFRGNSLNYAPSVAAQSGAPLEQVQQLISSLTGHGGPKVRPQMLPEHEKIAGASLGNLLLGQMVNKPIGIEDVAKSNDASARLGIARNSIETSKTEPLKALFELSVGNDQKSSPDLFKNGGDGAVFNTLTGKMLFNPEAVKVRSQSAPSGYQWADENKSKLLPIPGGPAEAVADERGFRRATLNEAKLARIADQEVKATERSAYKGYEVF
jgi:hypothetical protein